MRVFLSQIAVERWALEGRADLADGAIVPQRGALGGRRFPAEPAVRVLRIVAGDDAHRLVGKVKAASELRALGAEALGDSMLVGDLAYEVEPGFVASIDEEAARLIAPPTVGRESVGQADAEALARFLLNTLS